MSEKIFIAYCTSGLGNRLRPLASAIAYCQLTGRKLRVYWDSITPNGCLTPLERLYENKFDFITLEEIAALEGKNVGLFTEKGPGHGVAREAERFGRDQLLRLARHSPPQQAQALQLNDPHEIVIVYDNDYLGNVPRDLSIAALRSLVPKEDIRAKVLTQAAQYGLTNSTKGVHARGTDFNMKDALAQYSAVIRERIAVDRGEKFWLSTEDAQLEQGLHKLFPAQLISRHDRLHLQLNEGKQAWGDPDSYTVSHDHGVDALTDIYLLSCVSLVVYHPGSTFAEISRHLHGVLQQPAETRNAFEQARKEFIEHAKQLVPRGDAIHPLEIETGEHGPKVPEETSAAFMYWETLGYQIPFMERLFMNSYSGQPVLNWDGAVFDQLAAIPFEQFPQELFGRICPYKEAWSQMAVMRGYARGRKVLVIGSETFWVELLCVLAGAAEVTTVEYRPIHWSQPPQAGTLKTLTWDEFIGDLDAHKQHYDLVLSYSSIEHSGLGRYGDRITPLGDLFTFQLMARCMKPHGLCTAAVPTGQDLTHFNAHRIYGEKRIRAMQHVSGLEFIGIAGPDADYLASEPAEHLRQGWNLASLGQLPLGQYRQPILCFASPGFSVARYSSPETVLPVADLPLAPPPQAAVVVPPATAAAQPGGPQAAHVAKPIRSSTISSVPKVQIVHPDDNWILHRLAQHLVDNLDYASSSPWKADLSQPWDISYYFNQGLFKSRNGSRWSGAYFTHREPSDADNFDQACRGVDFCVAMCNTEADNCRRINTNTHLIYACIDMQRFTPKLRLGVIGRIYPGGRKGEQVWAQLAQLPFVELVATQGKVAEQDIPAFYQSIDYVLITSEYEGGPMCFIEGLASGKEIITTEVGMVRDFRAGPGIHLFDRSQSDSLVNLLVDLYQRRMKLRETIAHLGIEQYVRAHDELFRRLHTQAGG